MNSLKARLTIGAVLASLAVVALCGALLYELVEDDLEDEFDRNLLERARAQTALVEFDEDGLQFEWEHSPQIIKAGALPKYFQVRDLKGNLLAHSKDWPEKKIDIPRIDRDEDFEDDDVSIDGKPARAVALRFTPKLDDEAEEKPPALLLIVAERTKSVDETLARFRMLLGLAALVGVTFSVLLLRLILWRELKPLEQLAGKIAAVDESSLGREIAIERAPAELRPVVAQLNALLARVDDTLRREQEFTAGAAHELRTPLAGIRGKLEVALSRERTPEQHREFAQSCLDISVQMQAIVENLLTLARAGNSGDAPELVDLREALRAAWKPFAERAEKRGVTVDWEFAGEGMLNTRRNALHVISTNLLENAANYVNDGGRIEISTQAGPDGLRLEVANTGCTLDPNQAQRVFEPFWRADEVRTGGQAHAGLGLAICRRLAKAAGGEITVQVINDRFVATLSLP
ncbi:MAG: sensor histidine kinase N-terminal domain-containing protein [Planctomycetes bacterium]|nr:sensor histidine kinase N-terminal domain-containing protein [Planctomycetota bacterium]MCB9936558.1 sensor histidine kinase N-terminal domain-containing protein [Planctomycetota bacterium]